MRSLFPHSLVTLLSAVSLAALSSFAVVLSSAWAQVPIHDTGRPDRSATDGLALPPTGVALADEAWAPQVNPAGLGPLKGLHLVYGHEYDQAGSHAHRALSGDALFAALSFGHLRLGFALQWVDPAATDFEVERPSYRKSSYTLAFGGERLSLGASLHTFETRLAALDDLTSWDLGLLLRPTSWLSLGAAARDLNRPSLAGEALPRRFDLGLGLRPFGASDRFTLGLDWLFDEDEGFGDGAFSSSLAVEPVSGVTLLAGFQATPRIKEKIARLGIGLDFENVGSRVVMAVSDQSEQSSLLQLRLSTENYRSLRELKPGRMVELDLERELSSQPDLAALLRGAVPADPLPALLAKLTRVASDSSIDGLLLRIRSMGLGLARAEELHSALLRVRSAGKRVVALLEEGGDAEYLVACAAEKVVAPPYGSLRLDGLSATGLYLARGLESLGIRAEVVRIGAYKNAPDTFARGEMSEEERQQLSAYLASAFGREAALIAKARGKEEAQVRQLVERALFTAEEAEREGLVDARAYGDELDAVIERLLERKVALTSFPEQVDVPRQWNRGPRVALMNIRGTIVDGESSRSPFGGESTGAASAVEQLKRLEHLAKERAIAALVVRVDSGGGSASASEAIARAIERVKEHVPVVVSMGEVAGSGGYLVATAGSEILAQPETLTGSIGIFAMKLELSGLLAKLKVGSETLRQGEHADLFSPLRSWSEAERAALQQNIGAFYGQFVARVAKSRGLTREQVEALGEGRIFSGAAAKENGLVDRLGGLHEAIARARELARLSPTEGEVLQLPSYKGGPIRALSMAMRSEEALALAPLVRAATGGQGLSLLELEAGPVAMMPYIFEVK